jgi:CRP-like cAMP-binding protein
LQLSALQHQRFEGQGVDDDHGREVVTACLKPENFFGEMGLFE